jgi:hypothetical protein
MEFKTIEGMPESVKRFFDSYMKKHPEECAPAGAHNIYHCITVNRDGEITDEKFGVNILTNLGLNLMTGTDLRDFSSEFDTNYSALVLGMGDPSAPQFNDRRLNEYFAPNYYPANETRYASSWWNFKDGVYPLQYSNGLIYQSILLHTLTYDYNISGITEDCTITEMGIVSMSSASYNATPATVDLSSHALIYDEEAHTSYIIKHLNEKLIIRIYWAGSYKETLVNDLWNSNIHLVMSPWRLATGLHSRAGASFTFCGNVAGASVAGGGDWHAPVTHKGHVLRPIENRQFGYGCTTASETAAGGSIRRGVTTNSPFLMTNKYDYFENVLYAQYDSMELGGYSGSTWVECQSHDVFILDSDNKLSTEETLESTTIYTDDYKSHTLAKTFGHPHYSFINIQPSGGWPGELITAGYDNNVFTHYGEFPVVDFTITSSHMYNRLTDDWDIADTVVNNSSSVYYGQSTIRSGRLYITDSNNINRYVRVFVNTKTSIPMKAIKGIKTALNLYTTDKYWDITTWVKVEDPSNIPQAQASKKYIIDFNDNLSLLQIIRDQNVHAYTPTASVKTLTTGQTLSATGFDQYSYGEKILSSDANNWVMYLDNLVYYDQNMTSQGSIKLVDIATNNTSQSSTTFFTNSGLRFATDDFIIFFHTVYNKYNTTGNSARWQYQRMKIFRVADNYADMQNYLANPTGNVYEMAFTFTSADSSTDINRVIITWSNAGYLVADDFAYGSGAHILKFVTDNGVRVPKIVDVPNASRGRALGQTKYLVYFDKTDTQLVHIYDMDSESVYRSVRIPDGYTTRGLLNGFSNHLYIPVTDTGGTNMTYGCDITSGQLYLMDGFDGDVFNPYQGLSPSDYAVRMANYVYFSGDSFMQNCCSVTGDDCLIASKIYVGGSTTYVSNTILLTSDDPWTLKLLTDVIKNEDNPESKVNYRQVTFKDTICETSDHKHLIWLRNVDGFYQNDFDQNYTYGFGSTYVVDMGYILNGHTQNRLSEQTGHAPRVRGGATMFRDGIIAVSNDGTATWSPLECWLPHKVVGTTHTITSYNNPKYITDKQFKFYFSNDVDTIPPVHPHS